MDPDLGEIAPIWPAPGFVWRVVHGWRIVQIAFKPGLVPLPLGYDFWGNGWNNFSWFPEVAFYTLDTCCLSNRLDNLPINSFGDLYFRFFSDWIGVSDHGQGRPWAKTFLQPFLLESGPGQNPFQPIFQTILKSESELQTMESEFEKQAKQNSQIGFVGEFWGFLANNKKWWLLPILITLGLVGILILLSSTAAAPFIYTLF